MRVVLKAMMVLVLVSVGPCIIGEPAIGDTSDQKPGSEACVILLHGLCRSGRSMLKIQHRLETAGYTVINLDYDSTRQSIEMAAAAKVAQAVAVCRERGFDRIHFVTHSLGGLVVRAFLQDHELPAGSRVVMLAPPNHGSELADTALDHLPALYGMGGPAARELATGSPLVSHTLKPVPGEIGVIAGGLSFNPIFSHFLPGLDDGKVTVQSTRLTEMKDFIVLPTNHTLILWDDSTGRQILYFLAHGSFLHKS